MSEELTKVDETEMTEIDEYEGSEQNGGAGVLVVGALVCGAVGWVAKTGYDRFLKPRFDGLKEQLAEKRAERKAAKAAKKKDDLDEAFEEDED